MENDIPGTGSPELPSADSSRRRIRSFVRRQARHTDAQERAFRDHGAKYIVDLSSLAPGERPDGTVLFGNHRPVVLEIGFGMGHATAEIALANPDTNYLCAEVHTPGVGALLDRIVQMGLSNIRIIHHDVVEYLENHAPEGMFSGIHVFFPDPWPKKKHHKRRLIQAPFLDSLAPHCTENAVLYMATDWEDYALWMLDAIRESTRWENPGNSWSEPAPWRPSTAFERKGLAKDHVIREIRAFKRPGATPDSPGTGAS